MNYDLEKALSCGLLKSHLEYHSQVRTSQLQKGGDKLEGVQTQGRRMIKVLEDMTYVARLMQQTIYKYSLPEG